MGTWTALALLLVAAWFCTAAQVKRSFDYEYYPGDYGQGVGKGRKINNEQETLVLGDGKNGFTDTPPGKCLIKNVGKHPWIIRIKGDFGDKTYSYDVVRNTLITGVLVSTTRVLTTLAWNSTLSMSMRKKGQFDRYFLWMFGYNYQDKCRQGRHAKTFTLHPRSKREKGTIGTLGDFALYTPWEPFAVEGEPFLLQKPHPVQQIEDTINMLNTKEPTSEALLIFVFKEDEVGDDDEDDKGEIFQDVGSMFHFIGLPHCKELPNFKRQERLELDSDSTDASFFCGNGIPEPWNVSHKETKGYEGSAGSVAFYEDKSSGKMLPLGLYDYWMGDLVESSKYQRCYSIGSSQPYFHLFAAFTKVFFDWLDTAQFPDPPAKPLSHGRGDDSGIEIHISQGVPHSHSEVFWVAAIMVLVYNV